MQIADQPSAVHIAHDALHTVKGHLGVGRVIHGQKNAGNDHDHQHDTGQRAKVPPDVQIFGGGVTVQFMIHERENGQPVVDPADDAFFGGGDFGFRFHRIYDAFLSSGFTPITIFVSETKR